MHYYKRNLGDYAKKAGRLSMLQHGSYTLLIDACYDREQFPTRDEAIEWTWASSAAEIEAVEFVLRKFFVLDDGVYVQKRIQEEIDEYHGKSETNKRIAIEREAKRKENGTNRERTVNEPPPNQEPITNNQEPVLKPSAKNRGETPEEFEVAWSAYPKRPGASKADSLKAWSARIKAGATPEEILAGVKRYSAYVAAQQTEPEFIKQPATFFGPGDHFKNDWSVVPVARAGPGKLSRHGGFEKIDYSEGVENGRLI